MRAIVIGAGRGSRLQHETSEIPKTMVEVMGRPMLDWVLDALAEGGFARKDVVFICGYAEAVVKNRYPELTFVRNSAWESNNILASLLYARDYLAEGFVSTYADIVYEARSSKSWSARRTRSRSAATPRGAAATSDGRSTPKPTPKSCARTAAA
jgi:choline kinase